MRPEPIIVTAQMGTADQNWANRLRTAHFPAKRNHLAAHITLFHHLPPSLLPELTERLRRATAAPRPDAWLTGLIDLGGGVAYAIESPKLMDLRDDLTEAFTGMLTPQDQATPRLHITIQNKVASSEARALRAELARDFQPRPLVIAGLAAWHYCGGPWEQAMATRFRG